MPKTYNTFTNVSTGDVLTATNFNNVLTNVGNYRVPPMVRVRRTTNQTGYTTDGAITWESAEYDTDGMWTSGSTFTIQTAGLYLLQFSGTITGTATITLLAPYIQVAGTAIAYDYRPVFSNTTIAFSMSVVHSCAVGNTVGARASIIGGSAYVVNGNTTINDTQTRLSATWLGQVS